MNNVNWTKQGLAHSLSVRMEQKKLGSEFIMERDISDDTLTAWQEFYDANKGNPLVIESEMINLYQSIVAGFLT